jgi:hypothetical protein
VKNYGHALKFVKNQTDKICLAAVNQIGYALQFVKNQTDEICLAALKQNMKSIQYANEKFIKDNLFILFDKIISIEDETINEECFICYDNKVDIKLNCCRKYTHKLCLLIWKNSSQIFKCPHCRYEFTKIY